jgi:hypothetical protein
VSYYDPDPLVYITTPEIKTHPGRAPKASPIQPNRHGVKRKLLPVYPLNVSPPKTPPAQHPRTVFRKFKESPGTQPAFPDLSSPSNRPQKKRKFIDKSYPENLISSQQSITKSIQVADSHQNKLEQSPVALNSTFLEQWLTPGYEMRADEIQLLIDLTNQLSCTTKMPSIVIPWFTMRRFILSNPDHFPLEIVRGNMVGWRDLIIEEDTMKKVGLKL